MRKIKCVSGFRWVVALVFAVFPLGIHAQTYTNFTTIDHPLAVSADGGTVVEGIYGNTVVGYYFNSLGQHGFYHVLGTTNYTTLDDPLGVASFTTNTAACGISGKNIVGYYQNIANYSGYYGFLYNMDSGNYYPLADTNGVRSGASSTEAYAIDGTNIVGYYDANGIPSGNVTGFLSTFSTNLPGTFSYTSFYVDYPGPQSSGSTLYVTYAYGISGGTIVGSVENSSGQRQGFAFYRSNLSYTLLSSPSGGYVLAYGIEGNQVVGNFSNPSNGYNASGFVLTLGTTNFTAIDTLLLTNRTYAQGISDGRIVGYYVDKNSNTHGFVVGSAPLAPPVITLQHLAGGQFIFTVTNGVSSAPLNILSATNLLAPYNQWSLVLSNNFDANGNFVSTNAFSRTIPAMFYRVLEY